MRPTPESGRERLRPGSSSSSNSHINPNNSSLSSIVGVGIEGLRFVVGGRLVGGLMGRAAIGGLRGYREPLFEEGRVGEVKGEVR